MLSPSDTINFVNTVLRRSYNGTGSMDDNDDDDDYLQEFSMDEIDEIGQNGDDQSNSFRYMTMEVPNTILRNQSQTLLSSIDKSPKDKQITLPSSKVYIYLNDFLPKSTCTFYTSVQVKNEDVSSLILNTYYLYLLRTWPELLALSSSLPLVSCTCKVYL